MEWRDRGILLGTTPFGESSVIIDALTQENGRVRAVLRAGQSRKFRPILQIGNVLDITWRARLVEHMGSVQIDVLKSYPEILDSRMTLLGMTSLTSMLTSFLEDHDPQFHTYNTTEKLNELLIHPDMWSIGYVFWELSLLEALGFGDVFDCLQVLSYYWNNKVLPGLGVKIMPAARQRFIDLMQRHTSV